MIEIAGGNGQRFAAVLDLDPGSRKIRWAGQLAHDRDCTAAYRLLREPAAVDASARERKKNEPFRDPPGIVFEARRFQFTQLWCERFAERHPRQQLAKLHRPN